MVSAKTRWLVRFSIALAVLALSCQANSRTIGKIQILQTGINATPNEAQLTKDCKLFKPAVNQIRNYFTKAYIVPHRFGLHERYAPCYAIGTLEFSDFGKVSWTLTSAGVGSIKWDEGEIVDLYYRGYKWVDPTACSYGLGDVLDC